MKIGDTPYFFNFSLFMGKFWIKNLENWLLLDLKFVRNAILSIYYYTTGVPILGQSLGRQIKWYDVR